MGTLYGIATTALALALAGLVWIWVAAVRGGRERRRISDAVSKVSAEWHTFASEAKAERERLQEQAARFKDELTEKWEADREGVDQRVGRLEQTTGERVQELSDLADRTRVHIDELEAYIKDFFESELKTVFRSFDKTVGSVLGEMKSEMLRGIERIDQIQSVVAGKTRAQELVLEGESGAYGLLAESAAEAPEAEGQAQGVEDDLGDEEDGLPIGGAAGDSAKPAPDTEGAMESVDSGDGALAQEESLEEPREPGAADESDPLDFDLDSPEPAGEPDRPADPPKGSEPEI